MKLIDDISKTWRLYSVQAMFGAIGLQGVWASMPADLKASIPPNWLPYITITILVLGVIGRLIPQPKATPTVTALKEQSKTDGTTG